MFEPVRWDLTWCTGWPLRCTFGVHGVLDSLTMQVGSGKAFDFVIRDDGIADLEVPPEDLEDVSDRTPLKLIGESKGRKQVIAVGVLTVV